MAVTPADVKAIYPAAASVSDAIIQDAIDTAEMIVNEQLRPNCPMSEDRYEKITLYLACHILSLTIASQGGSTSGGALRRDKLGEADQSYATPPNDAFGYNSTSWGQMALALDTCGILAGDVANRGLKARFRVVGDPCT